MRRSPSIQQAFNELKEHQLPRGAVAYGELHTSVIHAILWTRQYAHTGPPRSTTERRIFEREVSTLEELRDELLYWAAATEATSAASISSSGTA